MLSFKCKNCGAEMAVSHIGGLSCPYCESKNFFSDKDLKEYRAFRLRMLQYLKALADNEDSAVYTDRLWNNIETDVYKSKDGMDITLQYIYKSQEDGVLMYTTRKNVIYIYPNDKREMAEEAIKACSKVTFPQADMKGLKRSFPVLAGRFELLDGGLMIAYSKEENYYPVAMFGELPAVQVEWIISRLENIACVLAFNEMVHGGITPDSVFINPKTHEAALFGGWYMCRTGIETSDRDLRDIRVTATRMLGKEYGDAPKPLIRFLQSKPEAIAYDDFAAWDAVIENELGGRHFSEFKI